MRQRRLLFSVHGIRTTASWQASLEVEAAELGWKHEPFRYGYFSIPRFLWNRSRKRIVEDFHAWYIEKCREFGAQDSKRTTRPSIVGHSFGSFVIGESMLKYREIKFDKIILCGSILPREFDWPRLLARNQVWSLRNEYGLRDRWARVVGLCVRNTGDSGFAGFSYDSPCIESERFDYHEHSDYFRPGHFREHWRPFLAKQSLEVSLRHGREIHDEREFVATLNHTHDIDTECFAPIPAYAAVEIPRGLSTTWIRVCPDIYTFLIDDKGRRVIGYVNAMPLSENAFRAILSGRLNDNEVTANDLIPFDRGERFWLYLMAVAIDPGARKTGQGIYQEGFERLLLGVEEKLIAYCRRYGSVVEEIGAVGWTPEGRKICEALGLVPCGTDRQGNPAYSLAVDDAVRRPGRLGGLIERLRAGCRRA